MEREEVGETWRGLVETRAMACSQSFARVAPSPPTCICPLMSTHTHTHTHTHTNYTCMYTHLSVCVCVSTCAHLWREHNQSMCASVENTQSVYVCICGEHTISLLVLLRALYSLSLTRARPLSPSVSGLLACWLGEFYLVLRRAIWCGSGMP